MQKAIFDTSIWIDLFRNVTSRPTDLLLTYISEDSDKVYITPTIIQEVIQGVKTEKDFREKLEVLLDFNSFLDDWTEMSISAAKLFFDLKKKGITIRKSNDCLIAAVAIKHNVLLVHNDSDFELIAQGSELRVY
jgi:predicted nucleic acid-binding protein